MSRSDQRQRRFAVITLTDRTRGDRPHPVLLLDGALCTSALRFTSIGTVGGRHHRTKAKALRALGLFYVYLGTIPLMRERPQTLEGKVQKFEELLNSGTVSAASGKDPLGLYWPAASSSLAVERVIAHLALYLYDLADHEPFLNGVTASERDFLTRLRSDVVDSRLSVGWDTSYDFLRHLSSCTAGSKSPRASTYFRQRTGLSPSLGAARGTAALKRFQTAKMWELVFAGCARKDVSDSAAYSERFRVRDQLLCTLICFTGCRGSELLHLFATDIVTVVEPYPMVRIRLAHPEKGVEMDKRGAARSREQYLMQEWGLHPRTKIAGKQHVGWKNLGLDHPRLMSTFAYLLLDRVGHLFLYKLFRSYLNVRRELMRSGGVRHPYLFVSRDGSPLSSDGLRDIWQRACRQIGLTGRQEDGQHPHSARHAYGHFMKNGLKLAPELVMQVMHHKSVESQEDYTRQSAPEVQELITTAYEAIKQNDISPHGIRRSEVRSGIDPKGYFSDFLDDL